MKKEHKLTTKEEKKPSNKQLGSVFIKNVMANSAILNGLKDH